MGDLYFYCTVCLISQPREIYFFEARIWHGLKNNAMQIVLGFSQQVLAAYSALEFEFHRRFTFHSLTQSIHDQT